MRSLGNKVLRAPFLLYSWFFSPALHLLAGAGFGCRFEPSCSHYSREALIRHGFRQGSWLSFKRIFRCHPFSRGGLDPVPNCQTPVVSDH